MRRVRRWWSDFRAEVAQWALAPGAILPASPGWWRALWITAPAILALIVLAAWVPGFREHFRMRPAVPLGALAAACAWGFGANALDARHPFPPLAYLASVILHGALFQILVLSLVLCSDGPGRAVLAPLCLLTAAFQSFRLRPTLRFPWPILGHALGMGAALAVARPADVVLLAGLCVIGLSTGVVCGTYAEGLRRAQRVLAPHAEAIRARALELRSEELSGLSASLLERMQRSHNARSALTSALLDAEQLARLALVAGAGAGDPYAARVEALRGTLETLGALLDTRRSRPGKAGSPEAPGTPVAVLPVIEFVLAAARVRTSKARLAARAAPGAKRARAHVAGGEASLCRILEILVDNAWRGDGTRGASRVDVEVSWEERTGALAIAVRDDGPGFPPALLERPIAPFASEKPGRTGLGLYTAQRLARASGGSLERENLPGGGARVTLFLQLAPPEEPPPVAGAREREP